MPKAFYTSDAEDDLRQITRYIARDNLRAARAWLENTRATCDLLAAQPALGQRIFTKRFGELRRQVLGNYLIYYEPTSDGIDVVHIVHGARDQRSIV